MLDDTPFPISLPPPFQFVQILGRGGMGVVAEALDTSLDRGVAVKTLLPALAADPNARERFLREAKILASIRHPNIIPAYELGEAPGSFGQSFPFFVMPLLRGCSLDSFIKDAGGPLPLDKALKIGSGIAGALGVVHRYGFLHRDVKPSNIWLEPPREAVVLLDFGLARTVDLDTVTHAIKGTPAFMSPEQANGERLTPATDIFSLGCLLYLMLTGRRPFRGHGLQAVLAEVRAHTPEPPCRIRPDLPPVVGEYIERMLCKDPAGRPGSASEVVGVLNDLTPDTFGNTTTKVGTGNPSRITLEIEVFSNSRYGRLSEVGVAPLVGGEMVRVLATAFPAAFMYLLWLDSDGKVQPIYPWQGFSWGTRPAVEVPRDLVPLPESAGEGWELSNEPTGMEAVVLLARPNRMTDAEEASLRSVFSDYRPQRPVEGHSRVHSFGFHKSTARHSFKQMLAMPSISPPRELPKPDTPATRLERLLGTLQQFAPSGTVVGFTRVGS